MPAVFVKNMLLFAGFTEKQSETLEEKYTVDLKISFDKYIHIDLGRLTVCNVGAG